MTDTALPDGLIPLIKNTTRLAVVACAVPGMTGPQRIEHLAGFSAGTISRWGGDAHKDLMPIEVAFLVEFLTQKPIFARALAALTGHKLVPIAEDEDALAELGMADLLDLSASSSRVQTVVADALQDGKVTPAERREILKVKAAHHDVLTRIARKLADVDERGA
ncbi:hypothetical protein FHS55_002149 [Angulomicrobium tetraedrale]|uniref:Uncharacterized protein n=1 Tax=Ancylobacter tetraedralis TaxID=217068 RepID=A0A839Z9Y3_9HYPH|nr:phage regulatory CII family protein [Ancylobacter tetraedralis]MBB3771550.1 hypothetical protein [Ancylobacter tetraedralis]